MFRKGGSAVARSDDTEERNWGAVRRLSQLRGVGGCEGCGGRRGEASG